MLPRHSHSIAVLACAATIATLAIVPRAQALPLYAARQGLPCATCHFDPQGGGPRNEFGFLYEKNRHALTPDVGRWADLVLSNKLGDALYFGTNLRQQYTFVHDLGAPSASDVSTLFPMQGALYVTFAPHPNLTLTYNRDLRETRDAWGMIHGLPGGLYFKAGQFRVPFGLRIDDHTGALRAGFREATAGSFGTSGFLPYDPRDVEGGIEVGFTPAPGYLATAALTNGGPVFANQAQAVTGKLAYVSTRFLAGASGFHNYVSTSRRDDRRGSLYAGLNLTERVQLLGEAGLGRSDDGAGGRADQRAIYGEADVRVARGWLVRAKYDFVDLDHRVAGRAQERYTLETDWTPVPFADLKLSLRRIVPEDAPDQNQVLLQWHFYY
ncbi:MAG: hypothetical protein ABI960_08215 [Candidatus Eisenbacteria bacterium]